MPKPYKPSVNLNESHVTDENVYMNRRKLLKSMGFVGASTLRAKSSNAAGWFLEDEKEKAASSGQPLSFSTPPEYQINETRTPESNVTTYNNFYEQSMGSNAEKINTTRDRLPSRGKLGVEQESNLIQCIFLILKCLV